MRLYFGGAVAALTLALTAQAHAATHQLTFSGATSEGAFTATAIVDVEGGYAVSGTGTISGDGLGSDILDLITHDTPGAHDYNPSDGTFIIRSNAGDDIFDNNDAVPLSTHNLLFGLQNSANSDGQKLLFGVFRDSQTADTYTSFLFGNSQTNVRFYESNGEPVQVTDVLVSAAPEPGTWVLMFAGVGLAGLALRRRRDVGGRRVLA